MNLPPQKRPPTTANTGSVTLNTTTTNEHACSNCGFKNRWLLHNVQLRGIDRRLCTSCVLRLHPSFFCPFCFEFFEHPSSATSSASPHRFLSCIKCSSLAHIHCLPSPPPQPSSFLCPPCSKPNFYFFDIDNADPNINNTGRVLDKRLALVLLCAARIASASMNKAVNMARLKADRSFREAAAARKRAKEALERFVVFNKVKRVDGALEVSGCRNLGTNKVNIQKVSGLNVSSKRQDFDAFRGLNKLPSMSPQNGLFGKENGNVRHVDQKNEVPDSGVDSGFRGNAIASVKDNLGNDGELGNYEGGLVG